MAAPPEVKTVPKPAESDEGAIIIKPNRKCHSIDSNNFTATCTGSGTAPDGVSAAQAAIKDYNDKFTAAANAVTAAASNWGNTTTCPAGCRKVGFIVGPIDWDFPTVTPDTSKTPTSVTVTISTTVWCNATVMCS